MDAKLDGLKRQNAGAVQALMAAIAAEDYTALEPRTKEYVVALKAYIAALLEAAEPAPRVIRFRGVRDHDPEIARSA
jgi:hypothetical protein